MKKVSLEELEEMKIKILENAHELVKDAEILCANKRFARAYSLAHLACEEMAKLQMLARSSAETIVGEDVNWNKLNRRMLNHKVKIMTYLLRDYFVNPYTEDFTDLKKLLGMRNEYNKLKNYSIYAGFRDNKFYKPSELFEEDFVKVL